MKEKEKKITNKQEKQKRKRRVSIITVFLWGLLIVVMSVITLNNVKKKNALEIIDNNWNIGLVMYDRSSNTPNEAITDFTWNATNSSENKELAMQINYNCTTGKEYQPGEIVIEVDGFGKNGSELNKDYMPKVTIAADKISNENKKYDWSYSYDVVNNKYTFINNNLIELNEHFEGTIQIVYNLESRFKIQTVLNFKAKLKENILNADKIIAVNSNICVFHYTSNKKKYNLNNDAYAAPKENYSKIASLIDDYYWVSYKFSHDFSYNVIYAYDSENFIISRTEGYNRSIKEKFPEGCVVYNSNFDKIDAKEDNSYYYLNTYAKYYVGYPKNKYNEGDKITNTAELWGRYEDENNLQKLSESTSTVYLVDFDFEYKGELYKVSKTSNTSAHNSSIKNGSETLSWNMNFTAFYTDSVMDVEIGDDLLYITRENGEVTKLDNDEYNFTRIKIPVFNTYNKYSDDRGEALIGYNYEVHVKHKGSIDYELYQSGTTSNKENTIIFDENDIVGIKVIIKNLDKTLYGGSISVYNKIYTENFTVNGEIYNFDYLQVYKKDEDGNKILNNETSLDNYITPSTLKIAEYDVKTYGRYMQRGYTSKNITDGCFKLNSDKSGTIKKNNVIRERYEVDYTLGFGMNIKYYDVDKDCIVKLYDILPKGVELLSSEEEIKNSIYSLTNINIFKLKNGTNFNNSVEFEKYIKENTTIEIDYNYKNSDRTKISIICNLSDIDWSFCLDNEANFSNSFIRLKLNTAITYDSVLEYGTSYNNILYGMWNNQEYDYDDYSINDNGSKDSLARDIDNDGDTEEKVAYDYSTINITHAVSSKQAVIKQVRTDLTKGKFVGGTAEVTAGSEYTYKLRITTGANSLKELIIYDTLETTYNETGEKITEGWKGEFLGVDTEYAVSKGYAPKVYYSEEKNPGKLTEVPEKWKELTNDVDKTKVKSICVDLRYKANGSEIELTPNNVVFILVNMRAPNDDTLLTSSYNMFSTNWRAVDPLGTVIDNIEGIYSNEVNVRIFRKEYEKMDIKGRKIWEEKIGNVYNFGKRPKSIIVKLMQNGIEYERQEVTQNDNWEYTFVNVPVYKNAALEEHKYTIEEEKVPYYSVAYDGYNIINTLSGKDIKVEKKWNSNEIPESITIKLLQDGIEYMRKEITEGEDGKWEYTFENVPIYRNENKEEYEYSIEEVEIPSYNFETEYNSRDKKYIIKNSLKTKDIEITKIWDDNENINRLRPEVVKVKLFDGEKEIDWCYIGEFSDWKATFKRVPDMRIDGTKIEYRVEEEIEEVYRGEFGYEDNFEVENGYELYKKYYITQIVGNTITNKYVDPDERIKITGTKIWNDEENKAGKRPNSAILQLKVGDEVISEEVATESNNWKVEFEVPRYDENKNEIKYHIDEKETAKFYEKELTDDYTVTNKFVVPDEKVKVEVIKLWEDLENKYGKRPDKITLQVLNGEKVVKEKQVSEKDNWRYEFEVQKYDELGNEIEYTVNEKEEVKYYEKRISGYTVINKCIYEPTVENEIDEKPALPNTSDINIVMYCIIFVIAIIVISLVIFYLKKK